MVSVQIEGKATESGLVESIAHHIKRRALFGNEQHALSLREAFAKQIGDGLALASSWRTLQHKGRAADRRANCSDLR